MWLLTFGSQLPQDNRPLPVFRMVYTQRRLRETLRLFRRAKAAEPRERERGSLQLDHNLRNKYAVRDHGQQRTGAQAPRWQKDDSDDDDDDYDPTRKQQQKKHIERVIRPKRKAGDIGDGAKEKKKARTLARESTMEELRSKASFITLKVASKTGKDQLMTLSEQYHTGLQSREAFGLKRTLGDASKDTWAWEKEHRKTYEQQFYEQSEEIDNTGGRALRNRKVPTIEMDIRKPRTKDRDETETEPQDTPTFLEQQQGKVEYRMGSTCGLPSPASTPPDPAFRQQQEDCRQKCRGNDFITISPSPSPTPECRLERISTDWAHPIDFHYVPGQGQPPCHFCANFRYGIRGLGKLRVTVKRTGKANKMYEELGDGNRNNDKEATRMCVVCALNRMYISNCRNHELKALPGIDPLKPVLGGQTMKRYVDQIIYEKGIEDNKLFHPVCSLCIGPALYRCCTVQTRTKDGRVATAGKQHQGCGLLICTECEMLLDNHKGVLRKHVIREHLYEMRANGTERRLRADIEFLFRGSLLHQAYGRV